MGEPLYSIGHGMVTYAAPLGWGVDQGVLIVRHVFADGSTILSFYGHLDPPSVVLRYGDCVERGEQIGQIGKPRTSPHLHFEIRSHMPGEPGPGYWSVDPTLAGWKAPSRFIWDYRIATAPGVLWMRSATPDPNIGLGMLADGTFAAIDDDRLVGIDPSGGDLRWSQPISYTSTAVMIDASGSILYSANRTGEVEAFRPPDLTGTNPSLVSMWKIQRETSGTPTLMPLPGGGVVVATRGQMFSLSAAGRLLWEQDVVGRPFDWALKGEQLIFTLEGRNGPVWSINPSGPAAWQAPISGRPVIAGDRIFVYAEDGIYRLDAATLSAEPIYLLPRGTPGSGDIVALPDGGLLVAHRDARDRRLIALNDDGTVRWQRSLSEFLPGQQHLLMLDGRPFLVAEIRTTSSSYEIAIFAIDLNSTELTRIFTGGDRGSTTGSASAFAVGVDRILVTVSNRLVMLDARSALETATQTTNSQ